MEADTGCVFCKYSDEYFSSDSPGSPKAKRRRSASQEPKIDEEDIPEWKKERSYTPEDQQKPRKWKELPKDSRNRSVLDSEFLLSF